MPDANRRDFCFNNPYDSDFCNDFCNSIGKLNAGYCRTSEGKKLLTWEYEIPGSGSRRGTVIPVDIRITSAREGEEGSFVFSASSPHLPGSIRNSDINELYNEVKRVLDSSVPEVSGIKWEDWLEIKVEGHKSDFSLNNTSGLGCDLQITVNRLKRGVDSEGKVVTINGNHVVVPFPSPRTADMPPDGSKLFVGKPFERAYLPETPENIERLRYIVDQMDFLRQKANEFLRDGNIQGNIDSISSGKNFLPQLEQKGST